MLYYFYDASGYKWYWDPVRRWVYMELDDIGISQDQNGEPAETLQDAIELLIDGGYMDKEQ